MCEGNVTVVDTFKKRVLDTPLEALLPVDGAPRCHPSLHGLVETPTPVT